MMNVTGVPLNIAGAASAAGYIITADAILTESGTTRTLSAVDNGKIIYCTSGSATTITCTTSVSTPPWPSFVTIVNVAEPA